MTSSNDLYQTHYPVIAPLIMCSGVGDGKKTACVMAQAATIDALRKGQTLDKPTDKMECACPVLRRLAIHANDTEWWKDDLERTEHLRPLIPLLLDSRGPIELMQKRAFFVADNVVRVLTPMRLEWIAAHTKNDELKVQIAKGVEALRGLAPIVDNKSAQAAKAVCADFRRVACFTATAYADASAYATATAYADASASADAYASASADAYAYASASAYAYAYASAYAYAYVKAQKLKYRTTYLEMFRACAALTV